ncbi:MAG: response regulator [Planctomycetota bacterium]
MKDSATVFVVDDDQDLRTSLGWLLRNAGWTVECFSSAREFLDAYEPDAPGCLILDVRMPEMNGLELQQELKRRGSRLPIIIMSGHADVPIAVHAIQEGALDLIEKPFNREILFERIQEAITQDAENRKARTFHNEVTTRLSGLTPREHEVFALLVQGNTTKQIAWELGVSARTVEKHRERVMKKMQVDSAAELILLAVDGGILERPSPALPARESTAS